MSLPLWCEPSAAICISVYRPKPSFSMDDLLVHLHQILKSLEKSGSFKFAVLRGLTNGSWTVVYAVRGGRSIVDAGAGADEFSEIEFLQQHIAPVADTIDCSRYELSCGESNERGSIAQLCKGEAVHFRWILADPDHQEMLEYSCLAVLKAYLGKVEGLRSCTFYRSIDGRKIAGLGAWENAQAAYTFISSPQGSPAEPFWKSLGAKLRYGICEVVYVTS